MATSDDRNQPPPSFAPSNGRRRPDAAGASVVSGHTDVPEQGTRVMPVASSADDQPPAVRPAAVRGRQAPPRRTPRDASAQRGPERASSSARRETGRSAGSDRAVHDDPNRADGPAAPAKPRRRRRTRRIVIGTLALLLVAALAWPIGLAYWANGKLQHVDALSSHADTGETTYLLAGSDSRGATDPDSTVLGARTDTILVLTVPQSGPTSLISIPRDTYVDVPGYGGQKINAAFSYGGAPLLVETVEGLIGGKVDHYVEVGFSGVKDVVDAVGGVRLCLDYNVDDEKSKLKWKKGCHHANGKKALAFSRMRYSDPKGDIGRAERQRQVIGAITTKLKDPALLWQPKKQVDLVNAGTAALTVDEDFSIIDLAKLALAFRDANGDQGVRGTPPIANLDYQPGNIGSSVLLDPDKTPAFFRDVREGSLEPGEVGGLS